MSSTDSGSSEMPDQAAVSTRVLEAIRNLLAQAESSPALSEVVGSSLPVIQASLVHSSLDSPLPAAAVANALARMAESGKLRRVYQVRLPNHQLLSELFDTLSDIPDIIYTPLHEPLTSYDVEVIPAYEVLDA